MADNQNGDKKPLPPYPAYKTLSNFIDGMRVTLPSRIDRSVMPSLSGANQGALIATLKFLKLITDDGTPTQDLSRLAKAQDAERKKILREILTKSYDFLLGNAFRVANATPRQIEEQFTAKTSATGETVRKCIAFFLAAAKDADIEVSPYLKKMRYSKPARSQRRAPLGIVNGQEEDPELRDPKPSGWAELLMQKFPTFDPAWPPEVQAKWFDAFKQMMDTMKENDEND